MCLIAYCPEGKQMPDDYIVSAYNDNSDGIGIMSRDGIEKFVGRKALKRAKRYLRYLHKEGCAYAIHFRYATHGAITRANCHPHTLPNDGGWLMHNGILGEYAAHSTDLESDTALFTKSLVDIDDTTEYWERVGNRIGWGNKLCVMLYDGSFVLVNEDAGTWRNGIWYSQTYSLPGNQYAWRYGYETDDTTVPVRRWRWDTDTQSLVEITEHVNLTRQPKQIYDSYGRLIGIERSDVIAANSREDDGPWRGWKLNDDSDYPMESEATLDERLREHLEDDTCKGQCSGCDKWRTIDSSGLCVQCAWDMCQLGAINPGPSDDDDDGPHYSREAG